MAGKENPIFQIAEALRRFAENPTHRKGVPLSPERQATRRDIVKELEGRVKNDAAEWTKKAVSKNPDARAEASREGKGGRYAPEGKDAPEKLRNAQESLKKAQREKTTAKKIDKSRTPPELQNDPTQIKVPEVALFTAAITQLPPELQDPNIVYREVERLYQSFDWEHATNAQKIEVRGAIDGGLKLVKRLASESKAESAVLSQAIAEDKTSIDYRLNQGLTGEESFDLYKSRVVEKQLPDPSDPKYQEVVDYNAQAPALEDILKTAQNELNDSHSRATEIESLENVRQQIRDGLRSKNFTEEHAKTFRALATARLEELTALEKAEATTGERVSRGGRKVDQANIKAADPLPEEDQKKLIGNLPSSYKDVAEKVFETYDQDALTKADLLSLREELNRVAGNRSAIDGFIKARITATPDTDEYYNQYREQYRNFQDRLAQLDTVIFDRLRPLEGDYGARAYFGEHREDHVFIHSLTLPGRFEDINEGTLQRIFDITHGIMDRATENPRAQFREGMDLYTADNFKELISTLKIKASEAGWHADKQQEFINMFTGVREMRELVHDMQHAGNFVGLEMLNKMVMTTLAGDLDAWIHYTPGMRFALSMYMDTIRSVYANNGGYLPAELLEDSSIGVTLVDQIALVRMEAAVQSGAFEELREISDLYRENPQKASEKIFRSMRVAKAFGIITLRTPSMMADAKVPRNFISGASNNLIQDMDPMRHLLVKYGLGKAGLARFYVSMSHDDEGGVAMLTMSDDQLEKFFYEKEQHPDYGKSLAEFRNFFSMADRSGSGGSFWANVVGMKDWSQEMREVRGVGLKLFDSVYRAQRETRDWAVGHDEGLRRKFGADVAGQTKWEIEEWWNKHEHDAHIHHHREGLLRKYVGEAMAELRYKLPGELLNRSSLDIGYEHLPVQVLEQTLKIQHPELYDKIMKKDGGTLVITVGGVQKEVKTLWELRNIYTGNNPTGSDQLQIGIPRVELLDLQRRLALLNGVAQQVSGDLTLVQQLAVQSNWLHAEGKGGVAFDTTKLGADMLGDFIPAALTHGARVKIEGKNIGLSARESLVFEDPVSAVEVLTAEQRQNLVKTYIAQIHEATGNEFKDSVYRDSGSGHKRDAYVDYLKERFETGMEHNMFTTTDVPIHKIHYASWGGSVLARTVGDGLNHSAAQKGLITWVGSMTGDPDDESMFKSLDKEVLTPMGMADPGLARQIGGFAHDTFLYMYTEPRLISNFGIAGRILTSEVAIETAEAISNLPLINKLTHGKIPRWMWGSRAQKLIDPGARRMTSSDVWAYTHTAATLMQLPQEHHPLRWAGAWATKSYTKNALRARYHGRVVDIIPQLVMTGLPIAGMLMLIQAIKEEQSEGKGGGGARH